MEKPAHRVVIISDLHLSEGWGPDGHLDRNEDFFFDQNFSRFLDYLAVEAEAEGLTYRLLINGDFVDFLQFTTTPPGKTIGGEPIDESERTNGLRTSAVKTCYKLDLLFAGHEVFFQALAGFIARGHHLLIGPGNHDIEWVMPEVREAFTSKLVSVGQKSGANTQGMAQRIGFTPWFYFDADYSLYAEHGAQYDDVNSFDYLFYPYRLDHSLEHSVDQHREIELPAGSFFVRYLFNQIEQLYPFADNMKPMTKFVRWILSRPRLYFNGEFIKIWRRMNWIINKAGPLPRGWVDEISQKEAEAIAAFVPASGLAPGQVEQLRKKWVPSAIHRYGKWRLFYRFIENSRLDRHYYRGFACGAHQITGARYVVFGHTHEGDLFEFRQVDGIKQEYVNSGSWTRSWAANYEEALLKEENEFVYVHFGYDEEKQDVRMDLLRWNDGLGKGERVRLFAESADLDRKDNEACQKVLGG